MRGGERRILSYWESGAEEEVGGKRGWLDCAEREMVKQRRERGMYDWILPSGKASCLLAG